MSVDSSKRVYFLEDGIETDKHEAMASDLYSSYGDSILPTGPVGSSTALPYYIEYSNAYSVKVHYKPMDDVIKVLEQAKVFLEVTNSSTHQTYN